MLNVGKFHIYKPSRDSSVSRASAWSHTVIGGMIAPGFESHQCFTGMWKRRLGCHAGCQEVGRCRTRGESQGMCNTYASTGFETQRRHHQKLKTGVSIAPQKGLMSSKNLKKKKNSVFTRIYNTCTYVQRWKTVHLMLNRVFPVTRKVGNVRIFCSISNENA